jgi:hypothetical protein
MSSSGPARPMARHKAPRNAAAGVAPNAPRSGCMSLYRRMATPAPTASTVARSSGSRSPAHTNVGNGTSVRHTLRTRDLRIFIVWPPNTTLDIVLPCRYASRPLAGHPSSAVFTPNSFGFLALPLQMHSSALFCCVALSLRRAVVLDPPRAGALKVYRSLSKGALETGAWARVQAAHP